MGKRAPKPLTVEELIDTLVWTVSRIAYHVDGCKGGTFATCRCSHAVTVRRLEKLIKRARPDYVTEVEQQAEFDARAAERDARRLSRFPGKP